MLPVKMYADGFCDIVNVDYSPVIIDKMETRFKHLDRMQWLVADIKDMTSLEASSFDVVLEKGTIDALLVAEKDPWKLSDEGENTITVVLNQARTITFVFVK